MSTFHAFDASTYRVTTTGNAAVAVTDTITGHTVVIPIEAAIAIAGDVTDAASSATSRTAPHLSEHLRALSDRLDAARVAFDPTRVPHPAYWHPSPYRSPNDWPTVPASMTKQCDNASVGVIVTNPDGDVLLFERATAPVGIAPPAGHIDDHGGPIDAAITEVSEETGLTLTGLTPITHGWRHNVCRRRHGIQGPGHYWHVYTAHATGELNPSPRETRNARWYSRTELQHLADRTVERAGGYTTAADFTANPGLEPVWVEFFERAGLIRAHADDLAWVDRLASQSPYASHPGDAQ